MLAHQLASLLYLGLRQGVIPADETVASLARRLGETEPSARDPFCTLMCAQCGTMGSPAVPGTDLVCCASPGCPNEMPWEVPRTAATTRSVEHLMARGSQKENTYAVVTYQASEEAVARGLHADSAFLALLRSALTVWVRESGEGRAWYLKAAARDANIGDLASHGVPAEIENRLAPLGISRLDVAIHSSTALSPHWTFDTRIVDDAAATRLSHAMQRHLSTSPGAPLHTLTPADPDLAPEYEFLLLQYGPDATAQEIVREDML